MLQHGNPDSSFDTWCRIIVNNIAIFIQCRACHRGSQDSETGDIRVRMRMRINEIIIASYTRSRTGWYRRADTGTLNGVHCCNKGGRSNGGRRLSQPKREGGREREREKQKQLQQSTHPFQSISFADRTTLDEISTKISEHSPLGPLAARSRQ